MRIATRIVAFGSLAVATVLLTACAGYKVIPQKPGDPEYAPVEPATPSRVPSLSGAIYQGEFGLDSMYSDLRAYRVGDLLTVKLSESTQAKKGANTDTNKATMVDKKNPTVFGSFPQFNVPGIIPLASNKDDTLEFKLDSNSTFKGSGNSSQNNLLQGDITVTVYRVLANGNLEIRGEKWINLNQGSEFIRLTGIVRPYDIEPDNSVPSRKIANPRITYSGTGALAEANQEGWLARFFNGPIYPY